MDIDPDQQHSVPEGEGGLNRQHCLALLARLYLRISAEVRHVGAFLNRIMESAKPVGGPRRETYDDEKKRLEQASDSYVSVRFTGFLWAI